jgi:hypothetical protein
MKFRLADLRLLLRVTLLRQGAFLEQMTPVSLRALFAKQSPQWEFATPQERQLRLAKTSNKSFSERSSKHACNPFTRFAYTLIETLNPWGISMQENLVISVLLRLNEG